MDLQFRQPLPEHIALGHGHADAYAGKGTLIHGDEAAPGIVSRCIEALDGFKFRVKHTSIRIRVKTGGCDEAGAYATAMPGPLLLCLRCHRTAGL